MTTPKPELGTNEIGTTELSNNANFSTQTISFSYTVQTSKIKPIKILEHSIGSGELGTTELGRFNRATTSQYNAVETSISGSTTAEPQDNSYSYTAQDTTVSGLTTVTVEDVAYSYTIQDKKLVANIPPKTISYSYSVEPSKSLTLASNEATYQYQPQNTAIDVLGNQNQITVLIDGQRIDTYTNIEAKRRLNEVDTFSFDAFITDSNDRSLINEGNIVKIIEDYDDLIFKGKLTEVEYKSNFRAKCEGDGMVTKLLNRKTDRETFSNTAGDDIVKSVVDNTLIKPI